LLTPERTHRCSQLSLAFSYSYFLTHLRSCFQFPQFSRAQNSPHVPGELLIAPKAGISSADFENQYKAHGGQKIQTLSQIKVHHIRVSAHALDKIKAALRKNPKVASKRSHYAWNKGVVLVACAMNTGSTTPYYPAALNNVTAVSVTNYYDNFARFSNYGNWIAVLAPGDGIHTTTNGGGYGSGVGTSLATPQAAGLAALITSLNPSLSNSQVVNLIKQNTDDLGSAGYDPYFGFGRINIYRTLTAAQGRPRCP
jgi:hypothetical protein